MNTNKRLLLVDDEQGIRTVLGITLSDLGYDVTTAEDAKKALEVFSTSPFPLVLTDIKMPGMDGIALLQAIKKQQPDTEVIMITGHGDIDLAVRSLQFDAADFVAKPINDAALEVALHRAEERISLRSQLREYTENLERMVEEKSRALIESERMAAAGEAATALSHTIKNLCSGLEGCTFLLEQGLAQDKREYMEQGWEMLRSNVTRLKNLSLDLLNHARSAVIIPAPSAPSTPIAEVTRIVAPMAQKAGISITTAIDDTLGGSGTPETSAETNNTPQQQLAPERRSKAAPLFLLDAEALERALLNLVTNAIEALERFSPRNAADKESSSPATGGHIRISLHLENSDGQNTLVYSVADNGPGMEPEIQNKLFTPFFTTKGLEGNGIGLSSTRRIVEQHKGSISVETSAQNGTLFTIRIPARPA